MASIALDFDRSHCNARDSTTPCTYKVDGWPQPENVQWMVTPLRSTQQILFSLQERSNSHKPAQEET